ncbi:DUF3006 domain-containing protein [Desulfitobacterium sp.]|uniref:DUF3006 domain-containing protein n=1 Tax=Desulfitobacterium sp. TaxID=49981 RepID=UPI002B1FC553|nr:DUF3006 domain-containing protein [Desulfitobacterium sp.]MEA4903127.1 DUF3006 domain-containing protein [Desulfitobacterium sp.]
MKGTIDRFEGNYAVVELENRNIINVPKELLPVEAREGDVIYEENGVYYIDQEETERIKEDLHKLMDSLWK